MTSAAQTPLGILDLVPITYGSDVRQAVCNALDLVQVAEQLGFNRYWFAEHHLNPGVAGTTPALLIAMAGAATQKIRLGSGGVQSGHRTALSVVEEFGLLDAMYPGRIDLGLGRSGGRDFVKEKLSRTQGASLSAGQAHPKKTDRFTKNGVLIPAAPSLRHLVDAPRLALTAQMLQQDGARTAEYSELVTEILQLIEGTFRSDHGLDPHPVPGTGADVEPWILGSSSGESAALAGQRGLRFAASYHISPSTALEAAEAYRDAFAPSKALEHPYLAVSADVVVAPDDESARLLASGYGLWVLSIRRGDGAMPFPDADRALDHRWSEEDRALVRDRVATQITGSPQSVARQLGLLRDAFGADEVIVTTITHNHLDRVRSYALLAREWYGQRGEAHSADRVISNAEREIQVS
jgi:alkanesulfonate monooxygenase SsuD/methylene tetrahydromethanopterin reductase-like flavin-dependent oxidoreductase (luciferase family)